MKTRLLIATVIACALAAPLHAQNDKMTPIATPAQPDAIVLNTGPLPGAKAFSDTYTKQFGNPPGPYAPLTYDGMKHLAWAIGSAGSTDSAKVIAALKTADFKDGLAGPISFRADNTLARSNFIVLEGKNGAWTLAQ